jgi:gliding motility-associated-like protein
MTLTVNPAANLSTSSDQTICEGSSASFTATSTNTSPTFQWTGPDNFSSSSSTITIDNADPLTDAGAYIVTVSAGGCTGTSTVMLIVNSAPDISINDSSEHFHLEICKEDPFPVLNAESSVGGVTFVWTLPDGSNVNAASVTVPSEGYGTYEVVATDLIGCTSETHVEILEAPCTLDIPNVITPNGDQDNQVFFIKNIETHPGNNLRIFNRWGNEVFAADSYQNNWDGEDLPAGTYYYILTTQEQAYSGTITLIREDEK